MSIDLGWLPTGVLVCFAIGLIIRARIRINQPVGKLEPSRLNQLLHWLRHQLPSLRTIGVLLLGFILGSWIALLYLQMSAPLFSFPALRG